MKFFALESHATHCSCVNPNVREHSERWMEIFPHILKQFFVFQYDFEFYCIVYCKCLEYGDHLDFKMDVLNNASLKKKRADRFDKYSNRVTKSNPLKDVLRDRDFSKLFNSPYPEVCYVYGSVRTDYAMVNPHEFSDYLSKFIFYKDRFHESTRIVESMELLDKSEIEYVTSELSTLYRYNENHYEELTDIQKISLTKLLSKQFLKSSA